MTPGTSNDLPGTLQDIVSALRHAQSSGRAWAMADALTCAGRAYRILQAPQPALAVFDLALQWSRVSGTVDLSVDVLCELCETHVLLANAQAGSGRPPGHDTPHQARLRQPAEDPRELARDCAWQAARLAMHATDPCWEITVLMRLSDLMDRLGEADDATALQARALLAQAGPASIPRPDAATAHGTRH